MRLDPTALFVASALLLAGGLAAVASRSAHGAEDDGPALPNDTASFGFVVRGTAGSVALLEATRPFSLALANGPVHGIPPERARFERASAIATRELGRYPASFLRKVHLAGVVFADDLAENDTPIPSLPNVASLLLLDATSAESDLVRALHHEIFHFFDRADDGRVEPDPTWAGLNPSSFAYGSGGRSLRGAWAARPSDDLPGFLSGYATSGVEEDKAETFAFAVTRAPMVKARAATDPVVRAKLAELTRRLGAFDEECARRLAL